jgi:RNA polymerase sigma-70 factor, ECF subfamily
MTLLPERQAPAAAVSSPDNTVAAADPGEAEVVRAAAAGNARAFDQLVQTHHRRVLYYLCNMVRHRQDAEDLTQQTFLKAYHHLGTFDCARPLINWLLTIARRTALNHFRDHKKWEHMPADVVSDAPSPARQLEHQDHAQSLWDRARRILAPREFEVLWLRFSEEMSTKETARIMDLTQIHIKVLVHRARQQLLKGDIRS